jgi:hypothetical protein
MKRTFIIHPLPDTYAICRLDAEEKVPQWALMSRIMFMARTDQELSFICCQEHVPDAVRADRGWCGFRVQGPFPLNEIGVLASVLEPLAQAGVSILASSTFDTDYFFVPMAKVKDAKKALLLAGHRVE